MGIEFLPWLITVALGLIILFEWFLSQPPPPPPAH